MQGAQVQSRRSNQSILKEISPGISLEGMMLKLKLQYFGHLMWKTNSLENPDAGKDWRQEEKGMTGYEMAGWHHRLNGHEFEWTPGDGEGQGGLVCCDSWGYRESDNWATELNWTELNRLFTSFWLLTFVRHTMVICDDNVRGNWNYMKDIWVYYLCEFSVNQSYCEVKSLLNG